MSGKREIRRRRMVAKYDELRSVTKTARALFSCETTVNHALAVYHVVRFKPSNSGPPPKIRCNGMTVRDVMEKTGLTNPGANYRFRRYARGDISFDELMAPRKQPVSTRKRTSDY